jgi:hypothetical protein
MNLLDKTLSANATFSGLFGLVFVTSGTDLAPMIAAGMQAWWLQLLGTLLLGFSLQILLTMRLASSNTLWVKLIIQSDVAWVVSSAIGLGVCWGELTIVGRMLVVAVALIVAGFTHFQASGLRQLATLNARLAVPPG